MDAGVGFKRVKTNGVIQMGKSKVPLLGECAACQLIRDRVWGSGVVLRANKLTGKKMVKIYVPLLATSAPPPNTISELDVGPGFKRARTMGVEEIPGHGSGNKNAHPAFLEIGR